MTCIGVYPKWFGKFLRWLIRRNKSATVLVKLRGRGHRHGIVKYHQDLPVKYASRVAIYIKDKSVAKFERNRLLTINSKENIIHALRTELAETKERLAFQRI